ncbi:MAG: haloalkane dehalogenase [Myxococcales bacterium]|nr:haloalkane dehalogenase [Myxococcales bacterium]
MEILRTPDARFEHLPGWAYEPRYVQLGELRLAYVDEGPRDGAVVLCLHGEPSWGYLYRKMMPGLLGAGLRVVVPDLVGFGRSDKPAAASDYTYQRHVDWMKGFLDALALPPVTLFCQDWGGLIGLRIAGEEPARFARIVASNTFLPTGELPLPPAFFAWQQFSQSAPVLPVGGIVSRGCASALTAEVIAAYDAPFPDPSYQAGARQFPMLVPSSPADPAAAANQLAWRALQTFSRPFLTAFGDADPITRGADRALQAAIAGAAGQPHTTVRGGHFIQEDAGPELASIIADFVART